MAVTIAPKIEIIWSPMGGPPSAMPLRHFAETGAQYLGELIRSLCPDPRISISLAYDTHRGIDVVEIDTGDARSGATLMSCDDDGVVMLGLARLVVLYHREEPSRPAGWSSDLDIRDEVVQRFRRAWQQQEPFFKR